ncbi:MAG: tetratricopeptide repeat protein [Xanthobacteraceae bacterium]
MTRLQATVAACKTIAQRRKHWLMTATTAVVVLLGIVIIANRRPIEQAIAAWVPWLGAAQSVDAVDAAETAYDKGKYKTALRLARPLAEKGDAHAEALMGLLYANGRGVPRDDHEAMKWFRSAADQGDPVAQLQIGIMYYDGRGVPQDYSEAARWYQLAAERGNPEAQYNLGIMYATGVGMPQDNILAHMWFNLAAARFTLSVPRDRAARNRDTVARKMAPDEIARAQELARLWKPKQEQNAQKPQESQE